MVPADTPYTVAVVDDVAAIVATPGLLLLHVPPVCSESMSEPFVPRQVWVVPEMAKEASAEKTARNVSVKIFFI